MSESRHDDDTWTGRVVDGRYRVIERIGHGGMGNVYKVEHTEIGKIAAMKVLHGNLAMDRELLDRFHREAEAISKLSHPNIVQVFDFGRLKDAVYFVMEYLKGEDLGTILRRDGPISPSRGLRLLAQVCDALAEAHANGIIHRDLKPENVRVGRTHDGDDFVKVLDFGLAKMLEEEKSSHITARGNLVGTPYYMAPEMIRGDSLDARCDIYSVGAMAYRMFTGENAFTAKTPVGVLTKHITDQLVPPSERAPERKIPLSVDALVLRAMAKDREHRFQSATDLKRAMMELVERLPPPTNPFFQPPGRRQSDSGAAATSNGAAASGSDVAYSPTSRISSSPSSELPVLSKEDLAFGRRMRGGQISKMLLLLVLIGAGAFAVYWYGIRRGQIYYPTEEVEPNNGPEQATPLLSGKGITGRLGKRVSATESDRDWYQIQVTGSGPQMLQVRVSGIPNMDLTVEIYDAAAGRITGADSAGAGGGEVLPNWTVDPGRYYLLVREVWLEGVAPTENVTDAYRLQVSWQPFSTGWEMEPNDDPSKATALAAGASLRGYLGSVRDVDYVSVTSAAGKLSGVLSGVAGADLVLEVTPSGGEPRIIDDEGESSGERFEGVAADGKHPILLQIRRKQRDKPQSGGPGGLDVPYTLKVWLTPGS